MGAALNAEHRVPGEIEALPAVKRTLDESPDKIYQKSPPVRDFQVVFWYTTLLRPLKQR
jgi:hypothetical protein